MEKVRRDPIISSLQMNIGYIRCVPIKGDGRVSSHSRVKARAKRCRPIVSPDPTPRCGAGRCIPAGGANKRKRTGESEPTGHARCNRKCTTLHQEHRQNCCGVFGYTLAGSDAQARFFYPSRVRCAKTISPGCHCICREWPSSLRPLRPLSLGIKYILSNLTAPWRTFGISLFQQIFSYAKFLPLISIHMIAFGGIGYAHVCCGSNPSGSHHQSPS